MDDPLSERGWTQMWTATGEFSDWTHVISSPLQRCRGFAEAGMDRVTDPRQAAPRYQQVAADLQARIEAGRYAVGIEDTDELIADLVHALDSTA